MEANTQVEITQIVGGNSSTRAYYSSNRCKITRLSVTIESIPDELLFKILLHLPVKDIYHAARLVCRKWNDMTRDHNFIYTHLHHSTYGLLCHDEQGSIVFVYVRELGEIETYKFMNYKFRPPIWTSCNGLVLKVEEQDKVYVIANLLTDQAFRLPPHCRRMIYPFLIGIGYAVASMMYKVFAILGEKCGILTLGVDKSWRFISIDHLSLTAQQALWTSPLITEGFMHWHSVGTCVVTLNVETEIIVETPPPIPTNIVEEKRSIYCFSTGRYLSLLVSCGELMWEGWEMKPETGEWRKLPEMLCLEGEKGRIEGLGLKHGDRIKPCGWVKYLEVLALRIVGDGGRCRFVCFYNLLKNEYSSKKVITKRGYRLLLHKNSLVCLGGR